MSQFYQKYLQENLPPAEALRQAQLAMWQRMLIGENPIIGQPLPFRENGVNICS